MPVRQDWGFGAWVGMMWGGGLNAMLYYRFGGMSL